MGELDSLPFHAVQNLKSWVLETFSISKARTRRERVVGYAW